MGEEKLRSLRRKRLNDYLKIGGGFAFHDILPPPFAFHDIHYICAFLNLKVFKVIYLNSKDPSVCVVLEKNGLAHIVL